jgi:large subunit ribosomal protein L16
MLAPKKLKHRKMMRGKRRGVSTRGSDVSFGDFGLKALEAGWVTANQIEAARITLSRETRKGGKLWIRIFPDKPITSKGAEVGMGGGKGDVANYVVVIRPGRVLFEISGVVKELAVNALIQAGHKLSIATKVVIRN